MNKIDFEKLKMEADADMANAKSQDGLEQVRLKYFSRKAGVLNNILKGLKDLPDDLKREYGRNANELKVYLENKMEMKKDEFSSKGAKEKEEKEKIDISVPGVRIHAGHLHPMTMIMRKSVAIFQTMGFEVIDGLEVETEFYNFDALNVPADHPSRDMQDTFWLEVPKLLMRTQTSSVQVRHMEKNKPPLRIVCPGRVFRKEATDATHEMQFYQLECLMVGKEVSLVNLKSILEIFFQQLLGSAKLKVRFRPSYFPFVEPGVEVDVTCFKCNLRTERAEQSSHDDGEKGCGLCKQTGWIEIGGAGMVHPRVLKVAKIDPREFSGFAFGMGMDRVAMLRYGVDDVRLFYNGDMRLLNQF